MADNPNPQIDHEVLLRQQLEVYQRGRARGASLLDNVYLVAGMIYAADRAKNRGVFDTSAEVTMRDAVEASVVLYKTAKVLSIDLLSEHMEGKVK